MFARRRFAALLAVPLVLSGCSQLSLAPKRADNGAQLFSGMGPHHRTITTDSAEAQKYFDQGLTWVHAFNFDEAFRSFERATQLDPDCAMAWWGLALCRGPQYNHPEVEKEQNAQCYEAAQKALALSGSASDRERALIEALATRYEKDWSEDRDELNARYADAMAKVWDRFPNDSDIGTLYVEAMMIKHPWDLYDDDQNPREETPTIIATLDRVIAMDADNPGANHLYIHAVEPSRNPENAVPAADRLSGLVPGSGHLQHMPTHIYAQVGMWEKSIRQNALAVRSDEKYRKLSPKQGIQLGYQTHNAHMLAFSAMMVGREKEALEASKKMWDIMSFDQIPLEMRGEVATFIDGWMCAHYDVLKRFGRWEEVVKAPPPPPYLPITTAAWRANRAVAYAAMKDFVSADLEYEAFKRAAGRIPEPENEDMPDGRELMAVANHFVAGEIALQRGDMETAIKELKKAIALEDKLDYSEPPQWILPTRHTLGAVYLVEARYAEAEECYRKDLAKWKGNGWSLYGLSRALESQGKMAEAREVRAQFERAWRNADEPTQTSCKCIPKT